MEKGKNRLFSSMKATCLQYNPGGFSGLIFPLLVSFFCLSVYLVVFGTGDNVDGHHYIFRTCRLCSVQ